LRDCQEIVQATPSQSSSFTICALSIDLNLV
jgi:hypothetical protein